MQPSEISLIITTYDRPDALSKVFDGLKRQTQPPGEIIIADDGSGAPTQELIAKWASKMPAPLRHIRQENEGYRRTIILNQCLAAARGSYFVILDGDCVPHAKFIVDHAGLAEKGCWVQGRRCYVRQSKVRFFAIDSTPVLRWMAQGKITGWPKGVRLPVPIIRRDTAQRGILGCNMGFWRDDAMAVNGFDEEYTGWGGEDSDIGTRFYHLGLKRKFVYGRAILYHLNHPWVDRKRPEDVQRRLQATIDSDKVRCERGVGQYLTGALKQP